MTETRKYGKYVNELEIAGEYPEVDGAPPASGLMLYHYGSNDESPFMLEGIMMYRPGATQGTGEEWPAMNPRYGSRYYTGGFKSVPYKVPDHELMFYMSSDKDHPEELGATVECWMGEGEDTEQYLITKPSAKLTQANTLHGPICFREVNQPIFLAVVQKPNMFMAVPDETPLQELRPGFDHDSLRIQGKLPGKKRKYDKYYNEIDVKAIQLPPSHKGKVTPLMFYDMFVNGESKITFDCRMIHGSGIGFGIGESTGSNLYDFAVWPQKHPFDEAYCFLGYDRENPGDLGGTVEFWLGEGDEAEEYIITKPTVILVKKNTVHLPAYVRELHKPFLLFTVSDTPIWAAENKIDQIPAGFRHEIG